MHHRALRHVLLVGAALLGIGGRPAGAQPAAAPLDGVRIVPGDYVRITVWRKPELSGEFLVAADSSLKHPLYQDVKVAGLPVHSALERIRTFLLRFEVAPQVSIDPLFQVAVGGEVRSPGLYRLSPETDLAQAIALAGGPSERGRLDRVRLLRGGRDTMIDLMQPGGPAAHMPVASGDRLFVERRRDLLRDYVGPLASLSAAVVSIVLLFRR